ncbi:hypothetical protein AVEN_238539-1 [Araneus ventricosus]|uniref:Mos1 transposase HTH domain-containing protein n=1 Tax=Araneus ventricosus TaxID=182803 RepID=A0A4Y2I3V0_ARAVE|nr:hypothetical protein AVEN_238539-1 [Araneus ventricosus]
MKEVYGEQYLPRCTVFRWRRRYEAGRVNIKDLPRPGQAHVVINSATISVVDELIRKNRRIITLEIAVELSISKGTVHHIIHKKAWLCAQWVPKHLSKSQRGTGSVSDPGVSTLKPSTPFLRAGISVSISMAIIYHCAVPHEL